MPEELLSVRDLETIIETRSGTIRAVNKVSLDVGKGEIVGLVGESGSGKSMTALSIVRLLPEPFAKIISGRIIFEGLDLVSSPEEGMRRIRGTRIGIIFQDSMSALDPLMTNGEQVVEAIRAQNKIERDVAEKKALDMLRLVGIPDPEIRFKQHPFEISGGMRQRMVIAMALAGRPSLLIADEPTTNLDVSIQAQILELLREIRNTLGTAILLITHNLGIVAWLCDRVYIMYCGKIMETGPMEKIVDNPSHPYTSLLLKSIPKISDANKSKLEAVPGDTPNLAEIPSGCVFNPRCPFSKKVCSEMEPEFSEIVHGHSAKCLMYDPIRKSHWVSSSG